MFLRRSERDKRADIAPGKAAASVVPAATDEFQAFYSKRMELSTENDCVIWGYRVVVPATLRPGMLRLLHSTRMGMSSVKQLARNYNWWPGIDKDIEMTMKLCHACQVNQNMSRKSMPHPWVRPRNPWERIHIDHAGPFKNNM